MKRTDFTFDEICKSAYGILSERGYEPKYHDGDNTEFSCVINGMNLTFCASEDDLFWFGATVELAEPMSTADRDEVERMYMEISPDDVVFENLHIDANEVCLSGAFPNEFFEPELIEEVIKTLESTDGIVCKLRAMQKK